MLGSPVSFCPPPAWTPLADLAARPSEPQLICVLQSQLLGEVRLAMGLSPGGSEDLPLLRLCSPHCSRLSESPCGALRPLQ